MRRSSKIVANAPNTRCVGNHLKEFPQFLHEGNCAREVSLCDKFADIQKVVFGKRRKD